MAVEHHVDFLARSISHPCRFSTRTPDRFSPAGQFLIQSLCRFLAIAQSWFSILTLNLLSPTGRFLIQPPGWFLTPAPSRILHAHIKGFPSIRQIIFSSIPSGRFPLYCQILEIKMDYLLEAEIILEFLVLFKHFVTNVVANTSFLERPSRNRPAWHLFKVIALWCSNAVDEWHSRYSNVKGLGLLFSYGSCLLRSV